MYMKLRYIYVYIMMGNDRAFGLVMTRIRSIDLVLERRTNLCSG